MATNKDLFKYNIVATLDETDKIQVLIANEKNKDPNKLYIINKIAKNNNKLFKDFFTYYNSEKTSNHIKNFFVDGEYIHLIFDYFKGENIKYKFQKELNTLTYSERTQIFQDILMKINELQNLPLAILLSITAIKNICIDKNKKIIFISNFSNLPINKDFSQHDLFKNISKIFSSIFDLELSKRNNDSLRILQKKCENNLYNSIPELIYDSKKIFELYDKGIKYSPIKRLINKYQTKLKLASKLSTIAIIILAVFFGVYTQFFDRGENKSPQGKTFTIGTFEYNSGLNDVIDTNIEASIPLKDPDPIPEPLIISPDSDVNYEDYIVKSGDTFESICKENYPNNLYISAIKSFNNMSSDKDLLPGIIIKLPNV